MRFGAMLVIGTLAVACAAARDGGSSDAGVSDAGADAGPTWTCPAPAIAHAYYAPFGSFCDHRCSVLTQRNPANGSPSSFTETFTYDGQGRVATWSRSPATDVYSNPGDVTSWMATYDDSGHFASEIDTLVPGSSAGNTRTQTFKWDDKGELYDIKIGSVETELYYWNDDGLIDRIEGVDGTQTFVYRDTQLTHVDTVNSGASATTTWTYDDQGRPSGNSYASGGYWGNVKFEYDDQGRLSKETATSMYMQYVFTYSYEGCN